MPSENTPNSAASQDPWQFFRLPKFSRKAPVRNANEIHEDNLSAADKIAMVITDKVGSFGFFMAIFWWTLIWCGYNILASDVPALHWKSFDPFPAFVAYLLISNVLQILLMPLIMVGQNLQGRHSEIRAQLDFDTNLKAEREVEVLLRQIEQNSVLLVHLMRHLNCRLTEQEERELKEHQEITAALIEQGLKKNGDAVEAAVKPVS
jgi:uncharacterized membrane protein